MIHPDVIEAAFHGALAALLWSETDDDETPFDETTEPDDVCDVFDLWIAIGAFMLSNPADALTMLTFYGTTHRGIEYDTGELFGHDFVLTANGHGVGFWDRGEKSGVADRLTEGCRPFGEISLQRGDDDGKVYVVGLE